MKKTGAQLISEERQEQIKKHGWSSSHDQQHIGGELAIVAATLATYHTDAQVVDFSTLYGSGDNAWGLENKLKHDTINRLKIAGALIAAEIDRLNNINEQ